MSRKSYLKNKIKRKKAKKIGLIQTERKPKRTVKIKEATSDRPNKSFLRFMMEYGQAIEAINSQGGIDRCQ